MRKPWLGKDKETLPGPHTEEVAELVFLYSSPCCCATSHRGKGARPVPKGVSRKEPGLPASGALVTKRQVLYKMGGRPSVLCDLAHVP